MSSASPVYLDYAATTPIRRAARDAWVDTVDFLSRQPGNPSSLHGGGRAARRLLEDARERLANALGASRAEVIFTSGATESAALALVGGSKARLNAGLSKPAIWVASGLDHPAVLEQAQPLRALGIERAMISATRAGVADVQTETLQAVIGNRGVTVGSLGLVCSETGVIQPVSRFVGALRAVASGALTHSDATQAVGNTEVSFTDLHLDLMTIGGHKFGAPVGTGALFVGRGVAIVTDRPGGGHERDIRSGTPDVAGAVALSVAAVEAVARMPQRTKKARALREQLLQGLPSDINPTTDAVAVPSIIHLSLPTAHPEVVLLEMDRHGIHVSAGSACHAGVTRPSSVLLHMGASEQEALGVLRVSVGEETTTEDIDRFLTALPAALEQAQRMDQYDGRTKVSVRR